MAVVLSGAQAVAATFGYVTNFGSASVSVINTATNTSVATIPVGNGPSTIAVTPDGAHVYVVDVGDSTVSVIATATNTVVGSPIPVGPSIGPSSNVGALISGGIAITPSGSSVYVANSGGNTVSVIATASNTVVDTIPVGSQPTGIAITPDGAHVYVANSGDSTVSVIATATNTVEGLPLPVGLFPLGVAITPDGTHAYIANPASSDGIDVIEIATNTVVDTILVDVPAAVAITPDGTHAYTLSNNPTIDNHVNETVSVIATATNMVVSSPITIGPAVPIVVFTIAVTPDGTGVYVPNASANSVSVVSTASNTVTGSVAVGTAPFGVAFLPHASVPSSGKACNGIYNGTFNGNITVSAAQNCRFASGGVTGNVFVTGGNFNIANGLIGGSVGIAGARTFSLGPATTIDGSLGIGLIAPGPTTDQVCGVNVLHDFGVAGDASPLQIGSTSPGSCAGNTISGNASIDVNSGAIALYNNSVTGTLSCLANKSITGGANTAKSKLGQCKAF